MYEVILGVVCIITVLFGIVFNFLTWREVTRTIENTALKIDQSLPNIDIDNIVQSVADEIDAIIAESMANFSMPTAQDHLFGMIGQFVQAKMMRDLNKDGLLNTNIDADNSHQHGEA